MADLTADPSTLVTTDPEPGKDPDSSPCLDGLCHGGDAAKIADSARLKFGLVTEETTPVSKTYRYMGPGTEASVTIDPTGVSGLAERVGADGYTRSGEVDVGLAGQKVRFGVQGYEDGFQKELEFYAAHGTEECENQLGVNATSLGLESSGELNAERCDSKISLNLELEQRVAGDWSVAGRVYGETSEVGSSALGEVKGKIGDLELGLQKESGEEPKVFVRYNKPIK